MNRQQSLTNNEKIIAFTIGFFTWFIGGFILGEYYRRKGYVTKSNQIKKYLLLGILVAISTVVFYFSFVYKEPTKTMRREQYEHIMPRLDDYIPDEFK